MPGTFACPECGTMLVTKPNAAGMRVRCAECSTLVEVPYLPRNVQSRRSAAPIQGWIIAGAGTVVAILMVIVAVNVARGRGQSTRLADLQTHMAQARAAEREGDWDAALNQCEQAMTIAARIRPCEELNEARAERVRIVLQAIEARVREAPSVPDPVPTLRHVRAMVESDPDFEPAREGVISALGDALERVAESELIAARDALSVKKFLLALSHCETAAGLGEELGYERGSAIKESALGVVREIVSLVGVAMGTVDGEFLAGLGGSQVHASALHPILIDSLKRSGYLPKPVRTAFSSAWDVGSPFRINLEIIERNDGTFFQTPLHTSRINAHVMLMKGSDLVWQARFQGQTRVPPPTMPAFEASRLSLARQRDAEVEKRLYDDARQVLADNLILALRKLPPP